MEQQQIKRRKRREPTEQELKDSFNTERDRQQREHLLRMLGKNTEQVVENIDEVLQEES